MIVHQRIRVDGALEDRGELCQQPEVKHVVRFFPKAFNAIDAALDQVKRQACDFESGVARHGALTAQPREKPTAFLQTEKRVRPWF